MDWQQWAVASLVLGAIGYLWRRSHPRPSRASVPPELVQLELKPPDPRPGKR